MVDFYDIYLIFIICKVDIGVEVNVIFKDDYDRFNCSFQQIFFGLIYYRIIVYGGYVIKIFGICLLYVY